MDWVRFGVMTVLEVVAELTQRMGHHDLSEKCQDCIKDVPDSGGDSKKEG